MAEIFKESLEGVRVIKRSFYVDERGYFEEMYRKSLYRELGIETDFVQDNHSFSIKGVIRGMHFQSYPGQAKLITVTVGSIYDVFVDIRPNSSSFGKYGARILKAEENEQLFIPSGYAHGFAVLSDEAHVFYKVSSGYNPETEHTFRYDDPKIGIEWPISQPILSEKDRNAKFLNEVIRESLDSRCCRTTWHSSH